MRRRVAVETGRVAAHQLRHGFLRMPGRFEKFLRVPVAAETADVGVGPGDFDGLLIGTRRIAPYVTKAVELGAQRTGKSVVRVAGVALPFLNVPVLEVRRGEGVAVDVVEVGDERRHDMA